MKSVASPVNFACGQDAHVQRPAAGEAKLLGPAQESVEV